MKTRTGRGWRLAAGVLLAVAVAGSLHGLSLAELERDPDLTPKSFAKHFSGFHYKFHSRVQDPEIFLTTRSGDCDDYATLAHRLLGKRGYRTHLIGVRMPGLTHAVCYVAECTCYLDYNNRNYIFKNSNCKYELREVAQKVAKSFDAQWVYAYEYERTNDVDVLLRMVSKTGEEKALDGLPRAAPAPPDKILIDF